MTSITTYTPQMPSLNGDPDALGGNAFFPGEATEEVSATGQRESQPPKTSFDYCPFFPITVAPMTFQDRFKGYSYLKRMRQEQGHDENFAEDVADFAEENFDEHDELANQHGDTNGEQHGKNNSKNNSKQQGDSYGNNNNHAPQSGKGFDNGKNHGSVAPMILELSHNHAIVQLGLMKIAIRQGTAHVVVFDMISQDSFVVMPSHQSPTALQNGWFLNFPDHNEDEAAFDYLEITDFGQALSSQQGRQGLAFANLSMEAYEQGKTLCIVPLLNQYDATPLTGRQRRNDDAMQEEAGLVWSKPPTRGFGEPMSLDSLFAEFAQI